MDWDDLYIEVHDELAAEYLEEHPHATESEAYAATESKLDAAVVDRYSEMVDLVHDISKGN